MYRPKRKPRNFIPRTLRHFLAGDAKAKPTIEHHHPAIATASADNLCVMTLNIAHGRRGGLHQLLTPNRQINANLDAIGNMFVREQPHVVALQEADSFSAWNGNYSHVQHLARYAGYAYSVTGNHIDAPGLTYGTAILSTQKISDSLSATFEAATVSPKGFVLGTILIGAQQVDVVSLHLDFARRRIQHTQIIELSNLIAQRTHPLILMGDFNVDISERKTLMGQLGELGLRCFRPNAKSLNTFPMLNLRIDWILVSAEFQFNDYRVVPDKLSDHLAVVADLKLTA